MSPTQQIVSSVATEIARQKIAEIKTSIDFLREEVANATKDKRDLFFTIDQIEQAVEMLSDMCLLGAELTDVAICSLAHVLKEDKDDGQTQANALPGPD